MKKILTKKVEGYLAENGKHYLPGVASEFSKEEWEAIPDKDKSLFTDPEPEAPKVKTIKEADNG